MNFTEKDESRLVIEYLNRYPDLFNDYERKNIINYSKKIIDGEFIPTLVTEVYDELGIIKDEYNIYLAFINILERAFTIKNKHILEVGGGVIPSLAKKITLRQEKGTITIYDPRLSIYESSTSKMKLVREKFTLETDVSKYNLLMGFMPCKAAEIIIDSAINNNKDFIVALCEGGYHGDGYDYFEDQYEWLHSIMTYARRDVEENNMGKLKIKYMDSRYNNPYPIIYNERKD